MSQWLFSIASNDSALSLASFPAWKSINSLPSHTKWLTYINKDSGNAVILPIPRWGGEVGGGGRGREAGKMEEGGEEMGEGRRTTYTHL